MPPVQYSISEINSLIEESLYDDSDQLRTVTPSFMVNVAYFDCVTNSLIINTVILV